MADQIREIMTSDVVVLDASSSVSEAARRMKSSDIGDVLVQKDGALCGIVTDRDLVLRCLAEGKDPQTHTVGDLCTQDLAALDADASIDDAIGLMRERAVRRLPVVDSGAPVGILSLGDLATERDPKSVLGQISAAPPTA